MKNLLKNSFRALLPALIAFIAMHFISLHYEAQGVDSFVMGSISFFVVLVVLVITYLRMKWKSENS